MAHHDIVLTLKENVKIPEFVMKALQEFIELQKELYSDEIELHISKYDQIEQIRFNCNNWYWRYNEDITDLIEMNKITNSIVEAYKWLLENTTIESDCWNACDAEYGPDSWDEFKGSLESAGGKKLIGKFKERYNL